MYPDISCRILPYSATVCGCASVCGVWGDTPTAPSGGDSCHQFTEGDTPSSLLHCSHHLEGALSGDDSCHQLASGDTPSSLLHCSHHLKEEGQYATQLSLLSM